MGGKRQRARFNDSTPTAFPDASQVNLDGSSRHNPRGAENKEEGVEVTEETYQARIAKRRDAIEMTHKTPEYQQYLATRTCKRSCDRPVSPDPEDRSVSKRSWETAVMRWRSAL